MTPADTTTGSAGDDGRSEDSDSATQPTGPAPSASDLKKAAEQIPDGPNVESSPWELQAARGETPLEGPRSDDDPVMGDRGVQGESEDTKAKASSGK